MSKVTFDCTAIATVDSILALKKFQMKQLKSEDFCSHSKMFKKCITFCTKLNMLGQSGFLRSGLIIIV